MTDIVPTEASRAIAAEYWDARNGEMGLPVPSAFTMNVLAGNLDDHRLVQLFARHAATARKEALEEIVEWLRSPTIPMDRDSTDAGIQAARDLWLADQIEVGAQSIERGE